MQSTYSNGQDRYGCLPKHQRHSMIVVPSNAKVKILRPMSVYGNDDAPRGRCSFRNVPVSREDYC